MKEKKESYGMGLEELILIEGKTGEEIISFTEMSEQNKKIIKRLYEKSCQGSSYACYEIDGSPSDETMFGGRMLAYLIVANDFISGIPDKNGKVIYQSGKGSVSAGFGVDVFENSVVFEYRPYKEGME